MCWGWAGGGLEAEGFRLGLGPCVWAGAGRALSGQWWI